MSTPISLQRKHIKIFFLIIKKQKQSSKNWRTSERKKEKNKEKEKKLND